MQYNFTMTRDLNIDDELVTIVNRSPNNLPIVYLNLLLSYATTVMSSVEPGMYDVEIHAYFSGVSVKVFNENNQLVREVEVTA